MKKKWISLVLTLVTATALFTGCGKEDTGNDGLDSNADTSVDTGEESEQNATKPEIAPYAYEDEINIIDDQYRNYYEIFVYSFFDEDGDGIGDLQGVIDKLDYVADMGFNGIWLMPIMKSTTYHKYDVVDYYAIDREYGTMEDLQELIDACHDRGIKLILDLMLNHTSSQHEWFTTACEYLKNLPEGQDANAEECPYVDYYHFEKLEGKKKSGYYPVGDSEWSYEGVFWSEMPDLNLDNEAVRKEFEAIAAFYLDMGIDGFRLDAAKEFFSGNAGKNTEVLSWFSDYVTGYKEGAYLVGEVWENFTTIQLYYESGMTSFFDFPMSQHNGKVASILKGQSEASSWGTTLESIHAEYSVKNSDYIAAPFLSNHDTGRWANTMVNNEDHIKYGAGLLLSMTGNPFVYYGEEIGMPSSGSKDENKRLPMIWTYETNRGKTQGPKNADSGIDYKFADVQTQIEDELSILNYYKRAVRIRNENPEIARGIVSSYPEYSGATLCVISKEYDGNVIYVVYNMGEETDTFDVKAAFGDVAICDYLTVDGSEVTFTDGVLSLPKYSICYLK